MQDDLRIVDFLEDVLESSIVFLQDSADISAQTTFIYLL